jgi:hypothetical protein
MEWVGCAGILKIIRAPFRAVATRFLPLAAKGKRA